MYELNLCRFELEWNSVRDLRILGSEFLCEWLKIFMSEVKSKPNTKKMIILMSLGLLIPVFLVSMAFLAVNSDAKNQEKYKQQQAEMIEKIKTKEAAEKAKADEDIAAEADQAVSEVLATQKVQGF